MEIAISLAQGRVPVSVFRLAGKLDVTTHEQFEEQIRAQYNGGMRHALIDLTEVSYISSAGLKALHRIFKLLGHGDGDKNEAMWQAIQAGTFKSPHLKLLKPTAMVREALTLVGYDMFLEIHNDFTQAVASF